jgi:hypothetical protein
MEGFSSHAQRTFSRAGLLGLKQQKVFMLYNMNTFSQVFKSSFLDDFEFFT